MSRQPRFPEFLKPEVMPVVEVTIVPICPKRYDGPIVDVQLQPAEKVTGKDLAIPAGDR